MHVVKFYNDEYNALCSLLDAVSKEGHNGILELIHRGKTDGTMEITLHLTWMDVEVLRAARTGMSNHNIKV